MRTSGSRVGEFADVSGTEEWTDDNGEVRELGSADFARMTSYSDLPEEIQKLLAQVKDSTIQTDLLRKEKVTLELSRPVLERFRAGESGWESRVDEALQEWMEEHKAS